MNLHNNDDIGIRTLNNHAGKEKKCIEPDHHILVTAPIPTCKKERSWEVAMVQPSTNQIAKEQQLLAEELERHKEAVFFWQVMLEMELLSHILLGTAVQLIKHHLQKESRDVQKDYLCSLLFIARTALLLLSAIHQTIEQYEED